MANWITAQGPIRQDQEQEAFLRSPEARKGHPTAPGLRDEYVARRGSASVADGSPGVPRLQPTPSSQGPGLPGPTPSGPLQPDVFYEGEEEEG
jgi:hypothetical protein